MTSRSDQVEAAALAGIVGGDVDAAERISEYRLQAGLDLDRRIVDLTPRVANPVALLTLDVAIWLVLIDGSSRRLRGRLQITDRQQLDRLVQFDAALAQF